MIWPLGVPLNGISVLDYEIAFKTYDKTDIIYNNFLIILAFFSFKIVIIIIEREITHENILRSMRRL